MFTCIQDFLSQNIKNIYIYISLALKSFFSLSLFNARESPCYRIHFQNSGEKKKLVSTTNIEHSQKKKKKTTIIEGLMLYTILMSFVITSGGRGFYYCWHQNLDLIPFGFYIPYFLLNICCHCINKNNHRSYLKEANQILFHRYQNFK